jgi:hypothetical protein
MKELTTFPFFLKFSNAYQQANLILVVSGTKALTLLMYIHQEKRPSKLRYKNHTTVCSTVLICLRYYKFILVAKILTGRTEEQLNWKS